MIAIVGHTKRAQQAHDLMERSGAAYVTIDNGTLGCEQNHRKAWGWLAKHNPGDWSVVLEDDAEPIGTSMDAFRKPLSEALAHAPGPIVSLYLGRTRPGYCQAAIRKIMADLEAQPMPSFITTTKLLHAVGVAIRTELVQDMLDYIGQVPAALAPVDEGIAQWAEGRGYIVSYTLPSLVNHAFGPTVIEQHHDGQDRTAERRAWMAGDRDGGWDGTNVTLTLPPMPTLQ